jgi:F0F1-type ATP synthase assembly protein I
LSSEGSANWGQFPLLAEVGSAMPLPRLTRPLRNVEPNPLSNDRDTNHQESATGGAGWDVSDFCAVGGIVAVLLGLLLALFPQTRPGGILVPIGLGIMAASAYAARKKDTTES